MMYIHGETAVSEVPGMEALIAGTAVPESEQPEPSMPEAEALGAGVSEYSTGGGGGVNWNFLTAF